MDRRRREDIPIPGDLDQVIRQGVERGRAAAARRARVRRTAGRSVCTLGLALALLAGGVNLSPAFAAAVSDLPVIGQLVRVFQVNQPLAQGGSQGSGAAAQVTMERSGDTEWIRLTFQREDAALYQAAFASYPKTVTITLPGTAEVEILSEISRAGDTSQYIKSVCCLPVGGEGTGVIQLELENDADVQLQEYRDPGSLVICLTPAEIQLDTVYSVRTLSYGEEEIGAVTEEYAGSALRVLRDDRGEYFVELAQCSGADEAEAESREFPGDVIVEKRTGNNVPVSFATMEAYRDSLFLDQFYDLLISVSTVEPVLDFMDRHFARADEAAQDTMLRGLEGLLEDEEEADWARAAAFYEMAGREPPAFIQEHLTP